VVKGDGEQAARRSPTDAPRTRFPVGGSVQGTTGLVPVSYFNSRKGERPYSCVQFVELRTDGLVVGPEPSKLMARVQIPVGAFSARFESRSQVVSGLSPLQSANDNDQPTSNHRTRRRGEQEPNCSVSLQSQWDCGSNPGTHAAGERRDRLGRFTHG
jgi:hypothetical protein